MTLYVFKNANPDYGTIAVSAPDIFTAMQKIKTDWFTHYFEFDFSVTIVTSTSGVQLQ